MARKRRPFVAVETDVAKDESFAVLADICGISRDEALGKIIRLWAWCADRKLQDAPDGCPGYAVPEAVITRWFGPDGIRGILGDGCEAFALGARWAVGLIYLRGTDETVAARRMQQAGARAGGESRAQGERDAHGRFVSETTNHPAVSPAVSRVDPRSQIPDPDQKLTLPRDPAVPAPPDDPVLPLVTPAAHARALMRRKLFFRAWQLAGEAFSRVQTSGIDTTAPNGWAGTPNPGSPASRNLMAIVDGLLVGDRPDDQAAEAKIANGIAVSEARARALQPPTARFLIPACLWDPDSWGRAVDMSPEQARAGPRGSAERARKTGRVEPASREAFKRGVQKI